MPDSPSLGSPSEPFVQGERGLHKRAGFVLSKAEKVPSVSDQALALVRDAEQLATCDDPARVRSLASDLADRARDLADQVQILRATLARTLAQHAEQGEALLQARQQATCDPLTGLANRRVFDQVLAGLIEAADPFVLCLIDIDHFKQVNDTHGHPAGDQVLRELARLLLGRLRYSDAVSRFGGEEFALLLPETTLNTGARIAEKVRTAIERHALRRSTDDHCPLIRITASVGVAEYQRGETVEDLLARADSALYRAKHNGRNQVELATGQLELAID